jgi:hypothetical protein
MNLSLKSSFLAFAILLCACSIKKTEETLGIKYLGEKTPDSIPLIFGKGIVSVSGRFDMGFSISPNGKSMAFGVAHETEPEKTCIYLLKYLNEQWTEPSNSFLADNMNTFFPMFAPSGKEIYFAKSIDNSETDLWVATLTNEGAIAPRPLDTIINSKSREAGHGVSRNGTFYFTSNRNDQNQCCGDIYFTRFDSGVYNKVKKSEVLSSGADEESLFLSPNEDYIILQAWKNEFESKHDLFISYLTKKGAWTSPKRLNSNINGKEIEQRPFVSPDNKFLFFSRMSITRENDQDVYESDIYWVSTKSVFSPYVYNTEFEYTVKYNEDFELKLPSDIFKDIDDKYLTINLSLEDGSAIPDWLNYNPEDLSLKGKWSTQETVKLKLTATDSARNTANFNFELSDENN